ncbi:MAG: hypothetical protein CMH54_09975 [Myxococcales bacterium]|nr:hypothetical protein [Myxococcales bacterium]
MARMIMETEDGPYEVIKVYSGDRGLSVLEAAKRIGISRSQAWRLVKSGEIRTVRAGTRVIVPVSAINAFLDTPGF